MQHFTSQYGFCTLKANRILLRSQILCRIHVRSVHKSGIYFTQKLAGQQIAARTVTELSVKGKTSLFKPAQRMLHALTPELWEDKRATSLPACLLPQSSQSLCTHRGHSNPRRPFFQPLATLKTILLPTKKKIPMTIRYSDMNQHSLTTQ